ncbi:RadC family protein [Peptoniphilus stercorisuis]|uniref:DNA repair protein RadC n=1 Tax=Peptoniphilus stercorisuis TaxID=1436965 RepID=A0ABS4KAG2_9FIRM|nr:DNA repair protein RadC [Peptoniphilus stercorisuis]MBP2024743.1 DNA repair protein RadC [Peptoniphilus stercorisuis]
MEKYKEEELKYTIKDMPAEDRPQEKLLKYGPEHLSNAELLALIIRTGSKKHTSIELSQNILNEAKKGLSSEENSFIALKDLSAKDLMKIPGVGESKASMIISALEISRRTNKSSIYKKKRIRTPSDMADFVLSDMRFLERENFNIAILNTKKEVESIRHISTGTLNATIVHPRDVFQIAIRENAHTIILIHNHPTGDPTPSIEDINITNRLVEVGNIVKIDVIDHIIIGDNTYYSFLENNLIS